MHFAPLLLLSALGVAAHPSGHAHMHRDFHEKRNPAPNPAAGDIITATINGKVVSWTQGPDGGSPFKKAGKPVVQPSTTAAPLVKPTPAAASSPPAASSSAASTSGGSTGSGANTYEPFCGGSKAKRVTLDQIKYKGNVGVAGSYGCNIKLIESTIADKYKYTARIKGGSSKYTCAVWLKVGPDGGINGFFKNNEVHTFTIPANGEQWLAFDDDTQGGFCCSKGDAAATTSFGQYVCPWTEFDFGNTSNGGWSGFDASALVAGATGAAMDGLQVCAKGTCSTLYQGGGGQNAYLPGMEAEDGIGGNIAPGPLTLNVNVAFQQ
ncbi:uncharacterized protein E0L32_001847 [Thyridium curvatum]|uniref:Allergen Asp f 4 n=1 Tax=Thyridium curvatum TaxID=1093900 RepID=A0A507AH39_9PEZI|nr:uncharacterized protein E0L32_001832 [Thyridium curvatum]XP_030989983.1 uncharacterized protein E0L32_001847 [Thyridium curvatum]TPX08257.1 hypothetical protein E0L32_001832 [Thyridium curvatum]TPX08272.1 hypothetical protein E0L32_001847 [Thyridium curvatum]